MAFCQCEYCNNICNMPGQKLCPQCSKELDTIYKKIRKYMYMTGERVTAARIVEELDVPEKAVDYLIRDNRLVLDRGGKPAGKCRICGAPTDADILCRECRKKFAEGMQKYQAERDLHKEAAKTGFAQPLVRNQSDKMRHTGSAQPLKRNRDD